MCMKYLLVHVHTWIVHKLRSTEKTDHNVCSFSFNFYMQVNGGGGSASYCSFLSKCLLYDHLSEAYCEDNNKQMSADALFCCIECSVIGAVWMEGSRPSDTICPVMGHFQPITVLYAKRVNLGISLSVVKACVWVCVYIDTYCVCVRPAPLTH